MYRKLLLTAAGILVAVLLFALWANQRGLLFEDYAAPHKMEILTATRCEEDRKFAHEGWPEDLKQ
jgi:hypothetical protein